MRVTCDASRLLPFHIKVETWTGLEPAHPGVKSPCVIPFHHHVVEDRSGSSPPICRPPNRGSLSDNAYPCMDARAGIEPAIDDSKSSALPLGYRAIIGETNQTRTGTNGVTNRRVRPFAIVSKIKSYSLSLPRSPVKTGKEGFGNRIARIAPRDCSRLGEAATSLPEIRPSMPFSRESSILCLDLMILLTPIPFVRIWIVFHGTRLSFKLSFCCDMYFGGIKYKKRPLSPPSSPILGLCPIEKDCQPRQSLQERYVCDRERSQAVVYSQPAATDPLRL